jgi:hypothetical protein
LVVAAVSERDSEAKELVGEVLRTVPRLVDVIEHLDIGG